MEEAINSLLGRLASIKPDVEQGDYNKNGLLYCGKCNTAKQCKVNIGGNPHTVTCLCTCGQEKLKRQAEEDKKRQRMLEIGIARNAGIPDKRLRHCTLSKDDGKTPKMTKLVNKYIDHWAEMKQNNQGLIFSGDVGCGKTFFAACIANALIEKSVPVLMTDFSHILSALQTEPDRVGYIGSLNHYDLLIIDDLGAERQSDYALEQVFTVVNGRYESKKPIIFTTNLSIEELKNPTDLRYHRIYDRILEMCIPVVVTGENRREEIAEQKKAEARQILFGKD